MANVKRLVALPVSVLTAFVRATLAPRVQNPSNALRLLGHGRFGGIGATEKLGRTIGTPRGLAIDCRSAMPKLPTRHS